MLTRIRNANLALHETVEMPGTKMKAEVARVLPSRRATSRTTLSRRREAIDELVVTLKYAATAPGHQRHQARVQARPPRLRQADRLPHVLGGMGIAIMSTSEGVITGHEAAGAASAARSSAPSGRRS